MKILSVLALLTITLSGGALFAQEKAANTTGKLVESKKFAFIVTDIKRKPGFNGDRGYAKIDENYRYGNTDNLYSVAASLALTSKGPGVPGYEYFTRDYYSRSTSGPSAVIAVDNKPVAPKSHLDSLMGNIYLVQHPDVVLVKTSPHDFDDLQQNGFYGFATGQYKLDAAKKNGGKWALTYVVGEGDKKRKFYVDVFANGKVVLKDEPNDNATNYLYGYIVDPQMFVKNLPAEEVEED